MPVKLAESTPVPHQKAVFGLPLPRITLLNLCAQIGIVLTGGAVRLTGSGLGCSEVPNCTEDSFFPTPELGVHGLIEFSNRGLGYLVGIIAILTFVAVWRSRRRDLYPAAIAVAIGVAAQGVIGAITVLTELNPWTVMGHFLVSMTLIAAATWLHLNAAGLSANRAGLTGKRRMLVHSLIGMLSVVLVLGTVTTGSGPHSGDLGAGRTGFDLALVSRLHANAVYLLVALTVLLLIVTRSGPKLVQRAAGWVLAAELLQGVIGIVQYNLNLPVTVVLAHMLGAALLVVATARLWFLASRAPAGQSRRETLARPEPALEGSTSPPARATLTDEGDRLPGGNVGGAWRVGETVRRGTGRWTPAVHALLTHLGPRLAHVPAVLGSSPRLTGRARLTRSCPPSRPESS